MANRKTAIGILLMVLIVAGPVWSQDLDGTLKKIKASSTLDAWLSRVGAAVFFSRAG